MHRADWSSWISYTYASLRSMQRVLCHESVTGRMSSALPSVQYTLPRWDMHFHHFYSPRRDVPRTVQDDDTFSAPRQSVHEYRVDSQYEEACSVRPFRHPYLYSIETREMLNLTQVSERVKCMSKVQLRYNSKCWVRCPRRLVCNAQENISRIESHDKNHVDNISKIHHNLFFRSWVTRSPDGKG